MVDEKAMLLELGDIFPSVGAVVPYVEIKFRLAGKYTPEGLETMLSKLVEKNILNKFEFNNSVNYKCKEDIPISLGTKTPTAAMHTGKINGDVDQRIRDLENIVFAIGNSVNDPSTRNLITQYKSTYQ